jgi:hypothetical protein
MVWVGAFTLFVAGCAQDQDRVRVTSMALTSGSVRATGKRTPVHTFSHDDYIWQLIDFSWDRLDRNGGMHVCTFNWYREGVLISKTPDKPCPFGHSPWTLETHRAAATLGAGHFTVETVVDGQTMATSSFEISP